MLILKRNVGESILIGDDIEVQISEIGNGYVKIGIEAPKDVKVYRKELILDIKEENLNSTSNLEELLKKLK